MADSPRVVDSSGLKAAFAAKAVVPRTQIAQAEQFLTHLSAHTDAKPDVQTGHKVLQDLETHTELYEFNAAILAGQEASSERDLDRRVDTIAKTIAPAEAASSRLREALKTIV